MDVTLPTVYVTFGAIVGACLGSWAHAVAVRLIRGASLFGRSWCPHCRRQLRWFELVPLLSWISLRGRCRTCLEPISFWYLAAELIGAVVGGWYITICTTLAAWMWMMVFFAVPLIVTMRTDATAYSIFDCTARWMIPFGIIGSALKLTPIALFDSSMGVLLGGGLLWVLHYAYHAYRSVDGVGKGDIELLAMIGSFVGPLGVWLAALIASCTALLTVGVDKILHYCDIRPTNNCLFHEQVPFGFFLAIGGLVSVIGLQLL